MLGADGLLYQTVEDLFAVGREQNPAISEFEASCFTGAFPHYVMQFIMLTLLTTHMQTATTPWSI